MTSINENQEELYENYNNNIPKDNPDFLQQSQNSSIFDIDLSDFKITELVDKYAFLCKCGDNPVLEFMMGNKIKFICNGENFQKEIFIQDVFEHLFDKLKDKDKTKLNKLRCGNHSNERNDFYCEDCHENMCSICKIENTIKCEHENKIILSDDKKIIKTVKYIIKKMEQRRQFLDLIEQNFNQSSESNEITVLNDNDNNINNIDNDLNLDLFDGCENEKIINDSSESNDQNYEIIDSYINLLTLIIYHYKYFPTYNLLKTISNAEKFLVLLFKDFNEINLKYGIKTKNIKDDSLKIFKDIFVNNNKEHCFLLINQKILDLSDCIKLSDILDINNINLPYQLEVKLIERKENPMTDMSFMFYEVLSLNSESNFTGFNTINITNMSYMFYNCYSLKKLPDSISNFETKNVNQMNYMFYNCSSIKELPDISKWNVENLGQANYMFCGCESLTSLPNISGWKVYELEYMNCMFKDCKSLEQFFDIKEWENKFRKIIQQNNIIDGCDKIISRLQSNDRINLNKKIKKSYKKFINFTRFKLLPKLYWPYVVFVLLLVFALILFFIYSLIRTIYYSFSIKETIKCFNDPNKYFNVNISMNNENDTFDKEEEEEEDMFSDLSETIFNLSCYKFDCPEDYFQKNEKLDILMYSFLTKINNITNDLRVSFDSFIEKLVENSCKITQENFSEYDFYNISENEDIFENDINSKLNQENKTEFETNNKYFMVLTPITMISIFSNIILTIIFFLNLKFNFLREKFVKLILEISFFLALFSIITGLLNNSSMRIMYNILNDFLWKIIGIVTNKKELRDESFYIDSCISVNLFFVIFSFPYIIMLIIFYCLAIKENTNTQNEPIKLFPNVADNN